MDSKQAELVEKFQDSRLRKAHADDFDSDSDDDLLEELENDDVYTKYREQRMQTLSEELKRVDRLDKDHLGELTVLDNEKELMELTSGSERVVIHFQKSEFTRCQVMNKKLTILAEKHLTVKFVAIDVSNATFLVNKLNIKVLPFVVGYLNGRELFRNVGFNNLGDDPNDFKPEALEQMMILHGVINRGSTNFRSIRGKQSHTGSHNKDSDSDLDL